MCNMRTFLLVGVFFLTAHLAVAQGSAAKPEKFGNATVDKYIESVYGFVDKQKGLSSALAKLNGDIDKAVKDEDEGAIDGLLGRFTDLETSYKALDGDSKKLSSDGATASKATSQCGTKAPKCAEGLKKATALLSGSVSSILADRTKMSEMKAKAEAAKKQYGKSGK